MRPDRPPEVAPGDGKIPRRGMLTLALDSSTATLSLAIVEWGDGAKVLAEATPDDGGRHGEALPGAIDRLLAGAGLSLSDLDGCAVGLGPGSFTGLRVGLATLKGLCYARRLPLAGVSSLRALAAGAAAAAAGDVVFCPLLDARRGEVYAGLFRGPAAEPLVPEVALPPSAIEGWLAATGLRARVLGEGLHAYRAALAAPLGDAAGFDLPPRPSAVPIALLAGPPSAFHPASLFSIEPSYVRLSEAETKHPEGTFVPHPSLSPRDP